MNKKSFLRTLFTTLKDLQSLFFPPICLACKGPVAGEDTLMCATCQANLPFTTHHLQKDNLMWCCNLFKELILSEDRKSS